jgi:glycosyltransferase involved in cell wall biosynthesis
MISSPFLSIIVPFYEEEVNVRPTYAAIVEAIEPAGTAFEMIFVNDGSRDRTLEVAVEIARDDPRLTVLDLRRNYGQTQAMAAGIAQARGQVLVTMDGDLQNDPADIPNLLRKLQEGYDIVIGWRGDRQDVFLTRRLPSRIANWLISKVTGVPLNDIGCSLKAYRGSLITHIPLYAEMHRFIPAMATIAGARVAEIRVRHHPRRFGKSKYGLSRIYKVLLDLMVIKTVTSFSARPLVWFALLATPLMLLGVLALSYALWRWAATPAGMSLPIAGTGILLLASSAILLVCGVFGELVYKLGDMRETDYCRLTQEVWKRVPSEPRLQGPA